MRARLDPGTPGSHVRLAYALAALGFAAFTLYGSLVPFGYESRSFGGALQAFSWVCRTRVGIDSRGDWLANCLLGVPLAFCLVGALRVRAAAAGPFDWVAGALAVMTTALYALVVEFVQLYFPERTSSLNDVLAQGMGGSVGAMAWIIAGRALTRRARLAWADPRSGGVVGQLLLLYCVTILAIQTLPWDIVTSPSALYHKLRDGPGDGRITLIPFADWPGPGAGVRLQTWVELVGLFLPAGLLAARLPAARRFPKVRVFGAGIILAFATEVAQTLVSRHPSATDALIGGAGVLAGFVAGRAGRRLDAQLIAIWVAAMALSHWQPFAFSSTPAAAHWLPFAETQDQNYLGALDNILSRALMFAPVGAFVASRGYSGCAAALAGFGLAAVLELGQLFLPDRSAATTELLTGSAAAFAGALVARRLARPEGLPG